MGTTIQDSSLLNWSYLLVGSPQPQLLAGKTFAVFAKTGYPTNAGSFVLRGTMTQQSDTTTINNQLGLANSLGDNLASLGSALNILLHKTPGATNQPLAQRIVTTFQLAAGDPGTASALVMLESLHPCLALAAGRAFAETTTGTTTYEIREVDPNTGTAGDVAGRVTVTPGAPVVLPAPGFPFQVVTNAPSDHLRIRLRWGTPDALRRLSLLQLGFNVWRIPRAAAESAGYNVTPPTPAQLHSDTNFKQVNGLPIMATMDYAPLAGPGGPDDPTDRSTYFVSDSNGRALGSVNFSPGTETPGYLVPPFNDGDQFYYFVTARDILGRDGLVSPGGLATACRKIPPPAPVKLSVLNTVQVFPLGGGAVTNIPRLLVRWAENTNVSDMVTQYWVYRWPNPVMALTNESTPSNNLVGVATQFANTNFAFLLDTNGNAPSVAGPSNYWYTVRAVSQTACGLLFSPNSAPASGVLRQRAAPALTTGELVSSCGTPVAMFQHFDYLPNPNGPDTNWNYRVTCTRRDAGIAWVQLLMGNISLAETQSFGPIYFPPDGNSVSVDFSLPVTIGNAEFDAQCIAGTYYGMVSKPAVCQVTNPVPAAQIQEAVFQTGELLFTALNSSDPFLQAANSNQSVCYPAINPVRDASGTVRMTFAAGGGGAMLIQFATNQGASVVWTDLAATFPDTNGVYSAYLCPCVIGPMPPLRGCTLNLPAEGNCGLHVPRAGDSGPVAPIHVRFRLTPRTHEYRVYRSVNGGELTLIAQGPALYDPLHPNNEVVRTDDAMPPTAARHCYFVQVLDENGNGSPLALLGCLGVVPHKPPQPVLSEPTPIGDTGNPQVALNWFCPTSGVYRFQIRVTRLDQPGSGKPSGLINHLLVPLSSFKPLKSAGIVAKPVFGGLVREHFSAAILFDEWLLTPPAGPGFGPGPQFSFNASVFPNVPYQIAVASEDVSGAWGDASTAWTFVWKPPPTNFTVPWPARPLPPVTTFDDPALAAAVVSYAPRVAAVMFTNVFPGGVLDKHYPIGIRIAELQHYDYAGGNVGTSNFVSYIPSVFTGTGQNTQPDPNKNVFTKLSQNPSENGQPLLPIVVYRQQVTNASFPRVSGNLLQVTPLIERIPWSYTTSPNSLTTIPDLLFALGSETVSHLHMLYVRDQQPVMIGAAYHYYVVRLNAQREVAEIIDAGVATIPLNP